MSRHLTVGRTGEDLAASFLAAKGLVIVDRNARTPFGEIDLIALDGDVVVFVEVKTRTSGAYGGPYEAVGRDKQRRLSRAAAAVLSEKAWQGRRARFDVVGVTFDEKAPKLSHVADAFDFVAG